MAKLGVFLSIVVGRDEKHEELGHRLTQELKVSFNPIYYKDEYYKGASPLPLLTKLRKEIQACKIMIGLYSKTYGFIPESLKSDDADESAKEKVTGLSITEWEYKRAKENKNWIFPYKDISVVNDEDTEELQLIFIKNVMNDNIGEIIGDYDLNNIDSAVKTIMNNVTTYLSDVVDDQIKINNKILSTKLIVYIYNTIIVLLVLLIIYVIIAILLGSLICILRGSICCIILWLIIHFWALIFVSEAKYD